MLSKVLVSESDAPLRAYVHRLQVLGKLFDLSLRRGKHSAALLLVHLHAPRVVSQLLRPEEVRLRTHVRVGLRLLDRAARHFRHLPGAFGRLWTHDLCRRSRHFVVSQVVDESLRELGSLLLRVEASVGRSDVAIPASAIIVIVRSLGANVCQVELRHLYGPEASNSCTGGPCRPVKAPVILADVSVAAPAIRCIHCGSAHAHSLLCEVVGRRAAKRPVITVGSGERCRHWVLFSLAFFFCFAIGRFQHFQHDLLELREKKITKYFYF